MNQPLQNNLAKENLKNPEFAGYEEAQPETQVMESPLKRWPKVYVAGKYSTLLGGKNPAIEILSNMRIGINWSTDLLCNNMIPFCPWLDYQFFLTPGGSYITEQQIRAYSMEWLKVCNAVFVVNKDWKESFGVKEELKVARSIRIPIFYAHQFKELLEWRDGFNERIV